MTKSSSMIAAILSPLVLVASCGSAASGDSGTTSSASFDGNFTIAEQGTFNEPWASAFVPGTQVLMITEKEGQIQGLNTETGEAITISGAPEVDYGGQGGLGDIAFLESEASAELDGRTIFLSWAEAGAGDTRGAVVGKGTLACSAATTCAVEGLNVIWRQGPKTSKRGHYSHRIIFSPDEQYMFVASGDRQELEPAQDTSNTLGTIVRLNLDGTPASGNPLAEEAGASDEIYSWGHRNILGMAYDAEGRLWDVEHGPGGGDELNLVAEGANYGWPTRSNGDHYNGDDIPDHTEDDGFAKPAIHWTPVIAPGDMIAYEGTMFGGMQGDFLIAGLQSQGLVRIAIDGDSASEVARYDMGNRIRSLTEGPDGALWVLEDGPEGRLLKLTPG
ncbi:PQQ-dependent sugar dehydrogenase [Qipengyuania sp. DGS5-3]|uniref:PQQ-dependent sugar dehydrogenase n=1 Tax=Qipengyuania sp. DGS5-3 TaxID=3349632 RepID=UPI0036D2EF49